MKSNKRKFIKYSTLGVLGTILGVGIVKIPYLQATNIKLRPPGAVDEKEFLGLCIKCGQCLQVCPYHSIHLEDIIQGYSVGTPYIDPLKRGCYLCAALPCILACPSGALDHDTQGPENVTMGVALLRDPNRCIAVTKKPVSTKDIKRLHRHSNLNKLEKDILRTLDKFEGKPCTMCATICPLPNSQSAIMMVDDLNGGKRPKFFDACVGCGACVEVCPTSVLEIKPQATYNDVYNKGVKNDSIK